MAAETRVKELKEAVPAEREARQLALDEARKLLRGAEDALAEGRMQASRLSTQLEGFSPELIDAAAAMADIQLVGPSPCLLLCRMLSTSHSLNRS